MLRRGPAACRRGPETGAGRLGASRAGAMTTFFRRLSASANKGKLWFGIAGRDWRSCPGRPGARPCTGCWPRAWPPPSPTWCSRPSCPGPGRCRSICRSSASSTRSPRVRPCRRAIQPPPWPSPWASDWSGRLWGRRWLPWRPAWRTPGSTPAPTGPPTCVFGSAIGAGAALVTRKWWPVRPPVPATQTAPVRRGPELPDGRRARASRSTPWVDPTPTETATALQKVFPKAYIKEIAPEEDVAAGIAAVATAARHPWHSGVWGGDGTVGTAAAAAVEHSLPLLVLPGGTLNHFARDAGTPHLTAAVRSGNPGRGGAGRRRPRGRRTRPPGQSRDTRTDHAQHRQHRPLPEPGPPARTAPARPGQTPGRRRGDVPDLRRRDAHHA